MVRQRVGQQTFRQAMLDYWGGACAVTGLALPQALRASHAKPWAECVSDAERLDVFNGFLLSANLDALFDQFLISFTDDGELLMWPQITGGRRPGGGALRQHVSEVGGILPDAGRAANSMGGWWRGRSAILDEKPQSRNENIGLPLCPTGLFDCNQVSPVVCHQSKVLDFVDRLAEIDGYASGLHELQAECRYQTAVCLDRRKVVCRARRQKGGPGGIEHGVVRPIASAVQVPRVKQ